MRPGSPPPPDADCSVGRAGATLGTAALAGLAGCSAVDLGFVGGDDLPEYAT